MCDTACCPSEISTRQRGSAGDYREGRQLWPRSPSVRSAQNLWLDLSVVQILATMTDSGFFGDAGCIASDLARSTSRPISLYFKADKDEQRVDTVLKIPGSSTPIEDSGPTPVPPGLRKLVDCRALPAQVAALRAHDAQLDRSNENLTRHMMRLN